MLAVWMPSGGVYGQLVLAVHYCAESLAAAWSYGTEAVADLPAWREVIERNPRNRDRFLALDRTEFIATMERWLMAYVPNDDQVVSGLSNADLALISVPTMIVRSGASDVNHTRATSEAVADLIPGTELVEPPWGDREWIERSEAARTEGTPLFVRWPLLVPSLVEWSDRMLAR